MGRGERGATSKHGVLALDIGSSGRKSYIIYEAEAAAKVALGGSERARIWSYSLRRAAARGGAVEGGHGRVVWVIRAGKQQDSLPYLLLDDGIKGNGNRSPAGGGEAGGAIAPAPEGSTW